MDSRQAAVLLVVLLLITDWGRAGEPNNLDGGHIFTEEDPGPLPAQDSETPRSFLVSLLQTMRRPSRSSAFLFQPQRFGRNTRGSWRNERLSTRAGEGPSSLFWSLAAPQRFGKK